MDKKIPLPKDEVNSSLLCCIPTRSRSGKRINGHKVVEESFDWEEELFILRLKNQGSMVTLTYDLIKSLHEKKKKTEWSYEAVNGYQVVNKSCVENGPSFVLNLAGQVEPVTVSKDLVKYLHAMSQKITEPKVEPKPNRSQGRNDKEILGSTSPMVGIIFPSWLE